MDIGIDVEAFKAQLKTNPPRRRGKLMPYVLFACEKNFSINGPSGVQQIRKWTTRIMDMSGCHAQQSCIEYYVRKGNRVLDYWFPKRLDADDKERFRDSPDQYAQLAAYCNFWIKNDPGKVRDMEETQRKLEEQNDVMNKKIAELQAQLVKKGGKSDG